MLSSKKLSKPAAKIESLESRTLFSASFLSHLTPTPTIAARTLPANGDLNPYGITFVPKDAAGGKLVAGDILVSNFNNSQADGNQQGTGTTIVEFDPKTGKQSLFFQGKPGIGLTTALGVLDGGFVLVGSVPTPDGINVTPPGSLLVIDKHGKLVETLTDAKLLDGPWDLAVNDEGQLQQVFVSNVLNGTITRLDFRVNPFSDGDKDDIKLLSKTQIASGYMARTDPAALVVGPTGLVFDDKNDTLYVASTGDNAIYGILDAEDIGKTNGVGKRIFSDTHLRGPLGLALAPNGNLLAANGDAVNADTSITNPQNSEIVEFTKSGKFVDEFSINANPAGAFGIAILTQGDKTIFAAVNDNTNQVEIWTLD
jgi:DNA-binding beta-propeller fold protein YncE